MVDVFISYKKERREHAERVAAMMEAHGFETFWDYELVIGPSYTQQLTEKLTAARAVIVLWCSGAAQSTFVIDEARRARGKNKLLPAQIELVEPPLGFGGDQMALLSHWRGDPEAEALKGLIAGVERLAGRPARRSPNVIAMLKRATPLPAVEPMTVAPQADANAPPAPGFAVKGPTPAALRWARIEASVDIRDHEDFLELFPAAEEAFEARLHRRQLEDWGKVDQANPDAIARFLQQERFAALTAHALREMKSAARRLYDRSEAARREAEAETARRAAEESQDARRRMPGAVWRDRAPGVADTALPEMVTIPAGRFLMGSPDTEASRKATEGPQREVSVPAFAMGRYAVTFEEYDVFCAATGVAKPGDHGWGRGRRPVINVSGDDARAYIGWLNGLVHGAPYRLPSEAEWEYACRAGTTTPFHFGATISTAQANYDGNYTYGGGAKGEYRAKTTPVGSFPANAFGLHDMHGNVWEWCADCWNDSYAGLRTDGGVVETGDCSVRVLRGGSCDYVPVYCRSAARFWGTTIQRNNGLGFRVSRTPFTF